MHYYLQQILMTAVFCLTVVTVSAADEALLEVLRQNNLISDAQYEALKKAEQQKSERPLPAADQDVLDVLDVLLANKLITQEQYAQLRVKTGQEKKTDPEAKVSLKDGFKIKSQDENFQAQVGTYIQFDSALYGNDRTDFSDGTELRRGRLSLDGTVFSDWDYKFEADFAGTTQGGTTNNVTVTDAFARYTGFRPVAISAGNFKVPFSLEAVGSAKYMTFMERGLPFAFLTSRQLGGMISTNSDNWTAAFAFFGDNVTSQHANDEGYGPSARITYAPLFQSDRSLHFGISGSYRVPPSNGTSPFNETVRFRSKPESNIISDGLADASLITVGGQTFGRSSGRLVDTGNIPGDVNYYALFGGELAGVYGPFSLQGEYIRANVDRETGGDLGFDGYYANVSWFLTGESRNYKADKGIFDLTAPKSPFTIKTGGFGAWELAARFSNLDLNDGTVNGGEIYDVTAGLNWYPNSYVRLMANYVNVLEVDGGAHDDDNPDVFQLRMQFAY